MTGSGNAQRAAQGIYCASRRRESSSVRGGTGAAAHVRSPLPPLSLLPFKFGALSTQFARVGPHGTDSWSGRTQYIHLRCRRPLHAALRLGALLAYIVAYAYAHHHAFMLVIASSPCQQRFLASRSFPTNFVFTSLPAQFFSSFIRSLRSEFASRFSHLSRCPCCLSSVAGFRFRGCLGRHERGWNRIHEPRGNAGRRTVGVCLYGDTHANIAGESLIMIGGGSLLRFISFILHYWSVGVSLEIHSGGAGTLSPLHPCLCMRPAPGMNGTECMDTRACGRRRWRDGEERRMLLKETEIGASRLETRTETR